MAIKARGICAAVFSLAVLAACSQDPIFLIISTETAPKKPRIEGAPTNMVLVERRSDPNSGPIPTVYVASGRLHWYVNVKDQNGDPGDPEWDVSEEPYFIPQPHEAREKIVSLAATSKRLYALCMENTGTKTTLRQLDHDGSEWEDVGNPSGEGRFTSIQSIFASAEAEHLFALARTSEGDSYAILYLDAEGSFKMLRETYASVLSDIAYRNRGGGGSYYLSTRGGGIFRVDEDGSGGLKEEIALDDRRDLTDDDKAKKYHVFMNMIKLKDDAETIIAIERNGGALCEVGEDYFTRMTYEGGDKAGEVIEAGKFATGALALWEDLSNPGKKMLIVGIQGSLYSTATSSYTHGYVEFDLDNDGTLNRNSVRRDAGKLQSVQDANHYSTSIGKHPINHLFQVPGCIDSNTTFFASTQTAGLWSYRERSDGKWNWNAEE